MNFSVSAIWGSLGKTLTGIGILCGALVPVLQANPQAPLTAQSAVTVAVAAIIAVAKAFEK